MKVYTLILGPMSNCTYVVENQRQAILIDPSWNMPAIYKFLEEESLKPVAVFFTHAHKDHMTDANKLLTKFNLKGYLEEKDEPLSSLPVDLISTYIAPKKFEIAGLEIDILFTPGHTRGSVCIKIDDILFTGDTLFVGSVGRTDLPGANPEDLIKSLIKIASLPKETIIYSGHSYGANKEGFKSTIGQELVTNPYLKMAKETPKMLEDML